MPPRVKDRQVVHPSAAGSEDRRHADPKARMPKPDERDGDRRGLRLVVAGGTRPRWSAHESINAQESVSCASISNVPYPTTSRDKEVAPGAVCSDFRALGGVRRCG